MGVFLLGADVVGENSYQANVSYDAVTNTNTVDFGWVNQRFAPLTLNLDYVHWLFDMSIYSYQIYPSFSYPIYYRPGRGLNVIRWSEGLWLSVGDRILLSSLSSSFSWPFFTAGLSVGYTWRLPFHSVAGYSNLGGRAAGVFDIAGGVLITDVGANYNLSGRWGPSSITNYIRGYDTLYIGSTSFFGRATLEYRHRLLKMRFGLWNPNVFFEDLYVNVFTDAAFDTQELLGASAGLELSPEIHLFWGMLRIAPVVGVSLNLEGKINLHAGVSTSLPFEILRSRKDAAAFAADPWSVTLNSTKAELLEPH